MVLKLDDERLAADEYAHDTKNQEKRPLVLSRINFLRLGIFTSFGVLLQQLWRLQLSDSTERTRRVEEAQASQLRTILTKPTRGVIYDRKMHQLVENVPVYIAGVTPGALPTDDDARTEVFDKLAGLLNLTYSVSVIPGRIPPGHENEVYNAVGSAVGWSPEQVKQYLARYIAGEFVQSDDSTQQSAPQATATPAPTATPLPATVDPSRKGADENQVQAVPTPTVVPKTKPKVDLTVPVDIVVGIDIKTAQARNIFGLRPAAIPLKTPLRTALVTIDGPVVRVRSEVEQTYEKLRDRYEAYKLIPIKKNLTREQVMIVREKHLELPGIDIDIQPTRRYSQTDLMAHVLGYVLPVNPDNLKNINAANVDPDHPELQVYEEGDPIGQSGIEGGVEAHLRGVKGYKQVMVDAGQRITREIPETLTQPQAGHNVVLTIDTDFQKRVRDILLAGIDEANKAGAKIEQGAAIVLNVNTGEVLAMVNYPTYDNNIWSKPVISPEEYNALIEKDVPESERKDIFLNRVAAGQYPPGSTFKLITGSAGLDSGVVSRYKTFHCAGEVNIPYDNNKSHVNKYKCWLHYPGHGLLDVVGGIKNSCDVFFYNVAVPNQSDLHYFEPGNSTQVNFDGIGIKTFHDYMRRFGIGEATGIELPEEQNGVAPDQVWLANTWGPKAFWSAGDTLQAGIGQGYVLVTPLQLTNVVSAIANGGTLNRPTLVYKILDAQGKVVKPFTPEAKRKLDVHPDVLATIREGMHEVMQPGGTAEKHIARLKGFQMGGKTGTAEWGEPYNDAGDRHTHAWFTGFAPFDKPEIAVTVLLPFGKGEKQIEGSTFSAPIAIDIVRSYFKLPDNPPTTPKA